MKPSANTSPQKLTAQALIEGGDRLQQSHHFSDATDAYTEAIKLEPGNAIAYHQRGWAKLHNGDRAGSIADWSKAIELNHGFADAYADRASAKAANDLRGALSDYKMALQLNPEKSKVLQPIINNINKRLHPKEKETEFVDSFLEKETGMNTVSRGDFLRSIGGMALATSALSLAGCNKPEGFNGKKGARWGMLIDLKRCVACKACVAACKNENKTPPGVAYNVFIEEEHGEFPHTSYTYFTRPCMQCKYSSCALVCPVKATYHRDDGIVVVDYDKCIGCRYCIAACPYGARSFDYGHNYFAENGTRDLFPLKDNPYNSIPSSEYNCEYGVREKSKSPVGNVRKCTFCLHLQDAQGDYREPPACSRTCMGKAIHFGDLNDTNGKCLVHGENLQELLARRNHYRLKEKIGNEPSVYYLT
ncbi:MAG: 4Fe-4S dicluster domain-containing protein [Bacteroidota bacterium]